MRKSVRTAKNLTDCGSRFFSGEAPLGDWLIFIQLKKKIFHKNVPGGLAGVFAK